MPTATIRRKQSSIDERHLRSIQVAAPRRQWDALRRCMVTASEKCQDGRRSVCGPFIARLDKTVLNFRAPRIGEPQHGVGLNESLITVDGKVCNWIVVAELILTFGDEDARALGAVIVPACSQVVFGKLEADE